MNNQKNITKINSITKVLLGTNNVFDINEISKLLNYKNPQSIRNLVSKLIKSGLILPISRGIYLKTLTKKIEDEEILQEYLKTKNLGLFFLKLKEHIKKNFFLILF